MKHIYMVRHQIAGFLHEFIFAQEPSDEQLAPIRRLMASRHGVEFRGEEIWMRVYKMDVIDDGAVPDVALPRPAPDSTGNGGAIPAMTITGTGIVR